MPRKKNKPKGRCSAYAYFVKDYQGYLKNTRGYLSFTECSKMCAARWKHIPEKDKQKYRKLAEIDALRYKREMKKYKSEEVKIKKRKRKRDPDAPARPLSAYLWFCTDTRPKIAQQHPDYSLTQVTRELAKLWNECDQETKKKFQSMAEYDRQYYIKEKELYNILKASKKEQC